MKNNKIKVILTIFILVIGVFLISNGVFNYLDNKNKIKKEEKETQEKDYYDPNSFNEYRDLEELDKKLIVTDFKFENKENKCEFEFTITNNYDEDINNKLFKLNFYDNENNLLNTFEYNIDYLGIHSRSGIKYFVETSKKTVKFTYEFDNEINEIKVS